MDDGVLYVLKGNGERQERLCGAMADAVHCILKGNGECQEK